MGGVIFDDDLKQFEMKGFEFVREADNFIMVLSEARLYKGLSLEEKVRFLALKVSFTYITVEESRDQ
jgi:hypothetical protein